MSGLSEGTSVSSRNLNAFPFFVGRGRSGTTLVRAMFDSHPDMAIPGESHFIVHLKARRAQYEARGTFDVELFLDDLLPHPRFRLWRLPDQAARQALTSAAPKTYSDAVRMVFDLYARHEGKTRYGDKTPSYVLHLPFLGALFPEAKFVHIIRDGRDVALSYLDVEFARHTVASAALTWKRFVERGRRSGRQLGPDRYREVRYEDLIEDPEGTLRTLCDFVGIEFDEGMLRYSERAAEVAQGSAFPQAHGNLRLPPTKGLRDWRRQMTREDVVLFESLAGDLLHELGYERAVQRIGVRARMHARRRQLQTEARRLTRRVRKRARMTKNSKT